MKNLICIASFLFVTHLSAQDSNFSVSLGYPLTNGENYFDRNDGIIDLGTQYRFVNAGIVDIGISVNASLFKYSIERTLAKEVENTIIIQPRLFVELNTPGIKKLKPVVGIGYAITSFKNTIDTGQELFENKSSPGGLNINLGLSYYIFQGLFIQAQYDYLKTKREEGTVFNPDEEFFQKISIIKLGVGYRF